MAAGTTATRIRTLAAVAIRTPIIALTAHAMRGDRERCLEADMDGYVSKPVRRDDLRREIERVLDPQAPVQRRFEGDEDLVVSAAPLPEAS